MARADDTELIDRFEEFYRSYYRNEIGGLAQKYPNEQKSLYVDWQDLYRFDPDLADDFRNKPQQLQEYAEEALRLYDLPVDVSLGQAHVRVHGLPQTTDIREIRSDHRGMLIQVQGIVRKATDVRPKITTAAFECQRCGTLTRIPQDGDFQEPHECQGCERQGPFRINYDQSEFIDAQKLRVQESPEGLRGGETPQSIDVNIEDDITGEVTAGDHVSVSGILKLEQQGGDREKSPMFDVYMDGLTVEIEDEQFEEMDITDEDKKQIVELSNTPDIYERMEGAIAPSIYGFEMEKRAMIFQLFSGVTKFLPDESRTRGDIHILLVGDPGTGKSALLQYIKNIAPRSVYTSGKGSSSAGLTAAAVRDDFAEGQQWTLEAGALVLADQGVAAIDELDKMRCVTGDTLVHTPNGIMPIRELAMRAKQSGEVEELPNGNTIRDVDPVVWTMTEAGTIETRNVTAIHEYDVPTELKQVTLESGESVTTTADHPFFVLSDGEQTTKPAEALHVNDWICVPDTIPGAVSDGGTTASTPSRSERSKGLTPAHGALLGYIAGDGNIYYSREDGNYGVRFTNSEEELLADFEKVCGEAFPQSAPVRHPSEKRDDGVKTVRLHGKQYADELLDCGLNLETYEGKRIPEPVTAGKRRVKTAFIRALADSEGTVTERNVTIHSASYELLLGTKMLLSEFEITSQIQTRERDSGRDIYILAITSDESLRAFSRHIGFTLTRKQKALHRVCERTTGTRAILDVLPECGDLFYTARDSLRLHQSECGLPDATYCNFENGDANFSLRAARTVLEQFQGRKKVAQNDRRTLSTPQGWKTLDTLRQRYHVSQTELANGTQYSQGQISRLWETDEDLKPVVQNRLRDLIRDVADTQLNKIEELLGSDVKWRRVDSVETVSDTDDVRPDIKLAKNRLARLLACPIPEAISEAETLLENPPQAADWDELESELRRHELSYQDLADRFDVAGSTISRWFRKTVDGTDFETVRSVAFDLIESKRARISEIRTEIAERRDPNVYDLTVADTHNFIANNIIIHNSEDQSAMHEALEQQSISVSKAGINATLKSRCSLLGAANPTYGRFDEYEPIGEQIDLAPPLISRFDLIFTVTDQPDEEEDAELAEHILQTNYAGELNTHREETSTSNYTEEEVARVTDDVAPTIEPELLRKYVAYAKRNCYPTMTEEAKSEIQDYYVKLRSRGEAEDAPVPVTARKLEALVRLAEASARVRLSDTVEAEDAQRGIDIAQYCLEDIGLDPETGELDADMIETGTSKSQRDRIKSIKGLIETIEEEYDEGAPVDVVVERAEEQGMDTSTAEHEIDKLKQKGEVYEPQTDHLRTT